MKNSREIGIIRNQQKKDVNLTLFSYAVSIAGNLRFLIREIKTNLYFDTTFYVNGKKITLALVWLRDDSLEYMRHLIDMTCVDHMDRTSRFNI